MKYKLLVPVYLLAISGFLMSVTQASKVYLEVTNDGPAALWINKYTLRVGIVFNTTIHDNVGIPGLTDVYRPDGQHVIPAYGKLRLPMFVALEALGKNKRFTDFSRFKTAKMDGDTFSPVTLERGDVRIKTKLNTFVKFYDSPQDIIRESNGDIVLKLHIVAHISNFGSILKYNVTVENTTVLDVVEQK